ncbi:hypothetical protein ACIQU5_18510 [Streptomyces sp. NPDC090306]|uniref:hypothetical protein n=1 Tax=unclassified Streptomyces TaxID=2593676 RepID=UPI0036E6D719
MADRSPYAHVPADTLASLALDGPRPRPPVDSGAELTLALAHLARCAPCDDALRQLRRAVAAGRSAVPGDDLVAPPARVWRAVLAEVRAEAGTPASSAGTAPHGRAGRSPRSGRRPGGRAPSSRGARLLLAASGLALLARGWRAVARRGSAGYGAGARIRGGARRGR